MADSAGATLKADPRRKLIVCCDGTWNKPFSVDSPPTNVVKMVRAIRPVDDNGISQLVYYHAGVGTNNWYDSIMGGAMGVGLSGNVQSCYDFLATNFVDGDLIFLFGFSRGAFTARSLAGLIGYIGLLEKRDMDLFPYVYDIYSSVEFRQVLSGGDRTEMQSALHKLFPKVVAEKTLDRLLEALLRARPAPIFFIGVWDTVGALGVPVGMLSWIGRSKYQFHDTDLSDRISYAYHALAIDEARGNFKPTLWTRPANRDPHKRPQTLEQVWFAGAHSNVGGGYPDCGLSDTAFLWMVAKAAAAAQAENSDSPLAIDQQYLKEKIDRSIGLLVDSRKKIFRYLPAYRRPIMAAPAPGKETCEAIHRSVQLRYQCGDGSQFAPFPYRPDNLKVAMDAKPAIATIMTLERSFRPEPNATA